MKAGGLTRLTSLGARRFLARRPVARWAECFAGNAIGYAQHYSRLHDAVIRVYDDAGNVIETHQHKGEFKDW